MNCGYILSAQAVYKTVGRCNPGNFKGVVMEIYKKLSNDKIKICNNKNPIEMKLFLSFLVVVLKRSTHHLGCDNGWTKYTNDEIGLTITGGIYQGVEYLNSIQRKEKLQNEYNDYINPFYLFDVMTKEGKRFFSQYYSSDIEKVISDSQQRIAELRDELNSFEYYHKILINEKDKIFSL